MLCYFQSKLIKNHFSYANENLNFLIHNLICMYLVYHFSIKYSILKAALSNFSAFLSNDSTVEANCNLCRTMTWKSARDKSKQKKPNPKSENVFIENSVVWSKVVKQNHQHTHPSKEIYSILAAHYFNTFINKPRLQ